MKMLRILPYLARNNHSSGIYRKKRCMATNQDSGFLLPSNAINAVSGPITSNR